MDLTSFLKGLALGLAGKPLNLAEKEKTLVGYSYNGTVLPALPEWDKAAYPYAYVFKVRSVDSYKLCFLASALVHNGGDSILVDTPTDDGIAQCAYYFAPSSDTDWVDADDGVFESGNMILLLRWANHDVCDNDGNIYLAASDPVPVYE